MTTYGHYIQDLDYKPETKKKKKERIFWTYITCQEKQQEKTVPELKYQFCYDISVLEHLCTLENYKQKSKVGLEYIHELMKIKLMWAKHFFREPQPLQFLKKVNCSKDN